MHENNIHDAHNICGIVTLYSPSISYIDNIKTYINFIDRLFVVDNSLVPNENIHAEISRTFPTAEILSSGKNIGIASALNLGIKKGLASNYEWLLTMDQDSYFDAGQIEKYFDSVSFIDTGKVAILSPAHEKKLVSAEKRCIYEKKDEVMTSGNLLNLSLTRKIGLFNEELFIDSVDHDYCLRAHLLGFDILQSINCFMWHNVGQLYNGSFLFGLKRKKIYIHSPERMYFIVRNGLYISKTYRNAFPAYTKMLRKHINLRISKSIRYSDERWLYIRFILKAYYDFFRKKYGNRVNI
jgi:rhamnosyltransferase